MPKYFVVSSLFSATYKICVLKMQKIPLIAFDHRYKKGVVDNLLRFLSQVSLETLHAG